MNLEEEHLSLETIETYLSHELSEEEMFRVDSHLGGCADCASRFRSLRSLNFAFSRWTARSHGAAYQRIMESTWIFANGVYQPVQEIRKQIYQGILTVAVLTLIRHRKYVPVHLGPEEGVNEYTFSLPSSAGTINIKRMPTSSSDVCSISITPRLCLAEVGKDELELKLTRQRKADEEHEILVRELRIPNGETALVENISTDGMYDVSIRWKDNVWRVPVPVKAPQEVLE